MADLLDRLAAYWYSLRFQDPEQIPARLRYWLSWRAYRRWPVIARLLAEPAARRCRSRRDFAWRSPPPPFRPLPEHRPDSLLRQFHQHYFDWAPHTDRGQLMGEIADWIARHPPGAWPAWHPYPTSLRIVNWIRAFGSDMPPAVSRSLAAQAAFLAHNLEFHLGGNHLLENAWALLAAGHFLDGPPARQWAAQGLELLLREVRRQVLADGGHDERSPYYHLRMTRLVSDAAGLLAALGRPVPEALSDVLRAMTTFGQVLRHLDGSVPTFQDAVFPPDPEPPASGPASFPFSGYYILDGPQSRLIADYGAPGAHSNPAHHHAGIFSFEISTPAGMVVVDSGTPTYDPGPERDRLRSTAAHNTVRVDGCDQFQLWGAFRVGRRAWVSPVQEVRRDDWHGVSATHNGFSRLGVLHRRSTVSIREAGFLVLDELEGAGSRRVESFLHLAPGVTPVWQGDRVCLQPLGWTVLPFGWRRPPEILDGVFADGIGRGRPSRVVAFQEVLGLPARCGYFVGPRAVYRLVHEAPYGFRLDDLQLVLSLFQRECSV